MSDPVRVVITGAGGRMGSALIAALAGARSLRLTAATERAGAPSLGHDSGTTAGAAPNGVLIDTHVEEALAKADVMIDFSSPEATLDHAARCAAAKKALVIGTTGFTPAAREQIAVHARAIPIMMAPNMSIGVNVLFKIAAEVAATLGDDYDPEIVETHHRLKKDSPSGTALGLAESVARALHLDPQRDLVKTRDGIIGERPRRRIGVQALRGGDVIGDHTVFFFGPGERLELTHRATSRGNFAQGALRAAEWIVRQPPGLYDMQDVLGLKETAR